MGYFFLLKPFLWTNVKSLRIFPLSRESWHVVGWLDGFLTVHRTSRCSKYVIPPAVGHKYIFI